MSIRTNLICLIALSAVAISGERAMAQPESKAASKEANVAPAESERETREATGEESSEHDVFGDSDLINNAHDADKSTVIKLADPVDTENCAEELILAAAKENVAKQFGDRTDSHGQCALGVRTSLELSGVGGVKGSLGNAVDFPKSLISHGFVDSGLRDPNTAPAGSIIVIAGPDSAAYLSGPKKGHYGSPPGTWLGHVTIKGNDGRYYTDGRTSQVAIGWVNGKDVEGIRKVYQILVPDAALVAEYANSCSRTPER